MRAAARSPLSEPVGTKVPAGGGRWRRSRRPLRWRRSARGGAAPGTATRTRCPRAARASPTGASSGRSRGAAALRATRGPPAPTCAPRYIESIYRCKHCRSDCPESAPGRIGAASIRRSTDCCSNRLGAHLHFPAMQSVTDYALARRAVLRDFRRGTLTRLDVCDAHPELMRAAQFIGTDIDDECPVCGATNLRLVSYVYGEKLKQANGRAISNQAELRKLGRVVRRIRLLRRRGLRRVPLEPPPPPVAPRPPARELSTADVERPQSSTISQGYCEHARDAPQLGLGDDRLRAGRVPRRRARRRPGGRGRARRRGIAAVLADSIGHGRILADGLAGDRSGTGAGALVRYPGTMALPGAERALDGGGGGDDRKPGAAE